MTNKMPLEESIASASASSDLRNRRGQFAKSRTLSQYAVSLPDQPEDVSGVHPKDDKFHFFKKGRDYQSAHSTHHYTADELKVLGTYESADVLPSHSEVYRQWLDSLPPRRDIETWSLVVIVGTIIGIIAFCLKEVCEKLQIFNNPFIGDYAERGQAHRLWMYYAAMSCTLASFASLICVYVWPFAGGSGLPELIGILNGAVVRNMLSYKTLFYKILSTLCTVLSSLPVGFEGPMISIGAMVAAAMARPPDPRCSCCTSKKLRIYDKEQTHAATADADKDKEEGGKASKCFTVCRYRDCKERHNLICMGAAAGVAAAFQSPITGLLFAMEEFSSFWSKSLTWQTFVCCILARSVTELLRSSVAALTIPHHHGGSGSDDGEGGGGGGNETHGQGQPMPIFEFTESALFDMKEQIRLNLVIIVPAAILGIIGGLSGALFIFMHLKSARLRRKLLAQIRRPELLSLVKVVEPVMVAFLCSMVIMPSLSLFRCRELNYTAIATSPHEGKFLRFHHFQCDLPVTIEYQPGKVVQTGEFHEFATLVFGSWEQMIRNLLSRKTAETFTVMSCGILLAFFFIFSNWSSLCSLSSGLLIPQLAIGALYGRLLGRLMYDIVESLDMVKDEEAWEWLDPGLFSLLGAASFLAGTSHLPVTSVVMLIEMTNDINMSLLIMIVVMLAKFIGGMFTHPLYHGLLEFKCIPYLDSDISVYDHGKKVNLELFRAADVMATPVRCVNVNESVQVLANLLLDTNHGGFPVITSGYGFRRTFLGIISRMELTILLTKTKNFNAKELKGDDMEKIRISYPDLPYINSSTFSLPSQFSLLRTYLLFRGMGARHLVITDTYNQVVGIITKKDLMHFAIEEKIRELRRSRGGGGSGGGGGRLLDFSPKDTKTLFKRVNTGIELLNELDEEENEVEFGGGNNNEAGGGGGAGQGPTTKQQFSPNGRNPVGVRQLQQHQVI